ncbi:MAG: hypothetical protein FJ090_20510 [Deltaproteobacteria bacterium]|nr:hypothetical protein [Deltaproteobacteria bacterium]
MSGLLALALAMPLARAADPVLVVVPSSGGPHDTTIDAILAAHDLERRATLDTSSALRGVEVLPLVEGLGPDCEGPVEIDAWRARLAAARRRVLVLQVEAALGDLIGLDLELECLSRPLAASDLAALDLARAEADLLLASAAGGDDPMRAAFYASEAAAALDRAAAAPSAAIPVDAGAEVTQALEVARARRASERPVSIAVIGRGALEVRLNGRPVTGPAAGVPGDNIVQLVGNGRVRGALRLHRAAGEGTVLSVGAQDDAEDLGRAVEGLLRGTPDPEEESLLLAIAAASVEPMVFVGWEGGEARAWLASGDGLQELAPAAVDVAPVPPPPRRRARREPAADRPGGNGHEWNASAGVLLGGAWKSVPYDGEADGLSLTGALAGRVRVASAWSVAWSVGLDAPTATFDTLGPGVDVTVPLRAGGRLGRRGPGFSPEIGLDVGAVLPGKSGEPRPLLAACGGGSGARAGTAFRLEACVGGQLDGFGVGLSLGLESRAHLD